MEASTATPTLVLRAYRGPEDHPAMTRAARAVRAFNGDAELGSVADMDNHYAHLPFADLPRDCALVEADGRVVGYGRASRQPLAGGDGRVDCILNIDPAARGQGVEELLVGHALRRSAELIRATSEVRTDRASFFVTGRDGELMRVLEARGLTRVRREAQLVRPTFEDIPDLPIPEPLRLRPIGPLDRAMHRRVLEADARAFAESYGQEVPTEAGFEEFINGPSFNPALWRVAFDGDAIAGQILSYMGDRQADGTCVGWTEAISVQPEYRRRGLARALLAESLRAVRDAGATSAGLTVDTQNPNQALTLYESLGFRIVSETFLYEWGPFEPGAAPWLGEGVLR